MSKNIFLIRHGETDYNQRGIVQGRGINASLNENGIKQANAFYSQFKSIPFDKVYTSKLLRTHQSVQAFTEITPHEQFEQLDEISWGIFEGKEINSKDKENFSAIVNSWRDGFVDNAITGGESPLQVLTRQKDFLPIITERSEEKNILICMHGRAMRIFLCMLFNLPLQKMDRFKHQNLCLYQLSYDNNKFSLIKENYVGHLSYL